MRKKIIVIIAVVLVLTVATGAFLYWRAQQFNYLIPGVPYYGICNLFFLHADSLTVSSVGDILGYWGDARSTIADLRDKFLPMDTPPGTALPEVNLKQFFEENGYSTYQWSSGEPGNEIAEIKKFINPDKKIPVIVYQKRSLDPESTTIGYRVVIGISDKDKKVIVHDHDFGHNYEIPYGDFQKMFQPGSGWILAVWPGDEIKEIIKGPDYSQSYHTRSDALNEIGNLLTTKGTKMVLYLIRQRNYVPALPVVKEFIADPAFKYFPPAFRVTIITELADIYLQTGQPGGAVEIITQRVLPINHDLDQGYEGQWRLPRHDRLGFPYLVLTEAFLRLGKKDEALRSYQELDEIRKSALEEYGGMDFFSSLERYSALDREFSSLR